MPHTHRYLHSNLLALDSNMLALHSNVLALHSNLLAPDSNMLDAVLGDLARLMEMVHLLRHFAIGHHWGTWCRC